MLTERTTLVQFLIEERRRHPGASGELNRLVVDVALACKAIANRVAGGALGGALGSADEVNVQGETQQKLDVLANDYFLRATEWSGYVAGMVSEELAEPYRIPDCFPRGKYLLVFDPLDGSSNIDVNVSVGSIFSILRAPNPGAEPEREDFLQQGTEQVCAGYAIYGPSTMIVLSMGTGVHAFTLDPSLGEFFLTRESIKIPATTGEFAINASNQRFWEPAVQQYVSECLAGRSGPRGKDFNMRWVASLVAETHRTVDNSRLAIDHRLDQVPGPPEAEAAGIDAPTQKPIATRQASGIALNHLASRYPALVGGSADLAASTNTGIPGGSVSSDDFSGRTIHFGIREHGMAAVMNGIAVHGGLRPFGSTFLVFADYLRPALRLSALMRQPVIYVFTHDSVHVGEDGPTHQPVEHIESLRLIPGVTVLRPADNGETAIAWDIAARNLTGPTVLILTRQSLPNLGENGLDDLRLNGFRTVGGFLDQPDVLLGASGSEVSLAVAAAELLAERGVRAAVISVMWRERLAEVLSERRAVLPDVPAVWIEAGVTVGWRALARDRDDVIGLNRFGESGPGPQVAAHLGLTPDAIVQSALETLARTDHRG